MREIGQLGIMAKKHHALQLVAELLNDVKQVMHRAGIQPVFHHDILALVIELLGDDLRCRERAPRRTRQAAQNVTGDARLCRDARSRDGSIRTELAAGVAPRCHWRRGLSRAERGTHADNLDNRHVEIFCATASARSMSAYFTNSLTPPTGLGLLGVAPRRGFLGRAARGSVAPRKMACRPLAGESVFNGSRPSTRAQGRGSLVAAPSNRGQKWIGLTVPQTLLVAADEEDP
jgi:hypothetical protein